MKTLVRILLFLLFSSISAAGFAGMSITSPERGSILTGDSFTVTWESINLPGDVVGQVLSFPGTVLTLGPDVRSATIPLTHHDNETSARLVLTFTTEDSIRHGSRYELAEGIAVYRIAAEQPVEAPELEIASSILETTNTGTESRTFLGWVTKAFDGEGGVQYPESVGGSTTNTRIYFETVVNDNPDLFSEQPWVSYPSHALHFSTRSEDATGESFVCIKGIQENTELRSSQKCFRITITAATPPVNIEHPPTFEMLDTIPSGLTEVSKTVPGWVIQASDGEGGVQHPNNESTSNTLIYFETVSNSHPEIFTEQPWVSYPSHALHFTGASVDSVKESEVCIRVVEENSELASSEQCFTVKVLPVSTHTQNYCQGGSFSCMQITSPGRRSLLTGDTVTFTWESINISSTIVRQSLSFPGSNLILDPDVRSVTVPLAHLDEDSLARLVIRYETEDSIAHGSRPLETGESIAQYTIAANRQQECQGGSSSCMQITSPERRSTLTGDTVTFTWESINISSTIVRQSLSFPGSNLILDPDVRSVTVPLAHLDEDSLARLVIRYETEDSIAHGSRPLETGESIALYTIAALNPGKTEASISSDKLSGSGGSVDFLILSLLAGLGLFRRKLKH